MPVARFVDAKTFEVWHTQACTDHKIPACGFRQSDGEPMPNNQWTTAYVQSFTCEGLDGILADVPDAAKLDVLDEKELEVLEAARTVPLGEPSKVTADPVLAFEQPKFAEVDGRIFYKATDEYVEFVAK